jgi:hypothetical protein
MIFSLPCNTLSKPPKRSIASWTASRIDPDIRTMLTFVFVVVGVEGIRVGVGGVCVGVGEEVGRLGVEEAEDAVTEDGPVEHALEASNAADPARPVFKNSRREMRLFGWWRLVMLSSL